MTAGIPHIPQYLRSVADPQRIHEVCVSAIQSLETKHIHALSNKICYWVKERVTGEYKSNSSFMQAIQTIVFNDIARAFAEPDQFLIYGIEFNILDIIDEAIKQNHDWQKNPFIPLFHSWTITLIYDSTHLNLSFRLKERQNERVVIVLSFTIKEAEEQAIKNSPFSPFHASIDK